ncbi:reverse transcriptase-like protein, partial [Staphylococcus nepalensis]|uniref:reverse transcriptase-like protein n=1 Tax=Staphylococcus nepalensis TaxID=214473 RepID=UPI0028641FF1
VKNQKIEAYSDEALSLIKQFDQAAVDSHPRSTNSHADALATLASAIPSDLKRTIKVEIQATPSLKLKQVVGMADVNLGGS